MVQTCELYEFADTLPPLTSQELIGEWSGGGFSTEHPFHIWLRSINWIGVTIRAEDDVQPIVVAAHTRDGPHKRRRWLDEWGNGEVSPSHGPFACLSIRNRTELRIMQNGSSNNPE